MEKITFDGVCIEITRRCDMACAHCFRGDAQDVDIDPRYLDAFLDQCEVIGRLAITGGEPLLNLDALEHLYDGILERGVMLLGFEIISNGHVFSKRFVDILKRFSELAWACNYLCRKSFKSVSREECISLCNLGISLDKYHADHDVCMENYKKYKTALVGYADVLQIYHGIAVNGFGRSKYLLEKPADLSAVIEEYAKKQIELFSAEHSMPDCKMIQTEKLTLTRPDQKRVLCSVYLDSFGKLKSDGICSAEYDRIDSFPSICTVSEPIWDAIIDYNRGRVQCTASQKMLLETINSNDAVKHLFLQQEKDANTNPDAQDEPSIQDLNLLKAEVALLRLKQSNHQYVEETRQVRCSHCRKVIQNNGRNIHCDQAGNVLTCQYCRRKTHIGAAV